MTEDRRIRDAHRLMFVLALVPIAARLTMRTPEVFMGHAKMDALVLHDWWPVMLLPW